VLLGVRAKNRARACAITVLSSCCWCRYTHISACCTAGSPDHDQDFVCNDTSQYGCLPRLRLVQNRSVTRSPAAVASHGLPRTDTPGHTPNAPPPCPPYPPTASSNLAWAGRRRQCSTAAVAAAAVAAAAVVFASRRPCLVGARRADAKQRDQQARPDGQPDQQRVRGNFALPKFQVAACRNAGTGGGQAASAGHCQVGVAGGRADRGSGVACTCTRNPWPGT